MRVLWFTVTPSNFDVNNTSHNGGGWISSLETAFDKHTDIDLGIAFEHPNTNFRIEKNGKTYYPISASNTRDYKFRKKVDFNF